MKKQLMIALLSMAPALGVVAQDKLYKDEFPLGDITLLDGPLKHASAFAGFGRKQSA